MSIEFSLAGKKLTARSGILELMDDLGRAMTEHPDMLMLGGGNPAAVPSIQKIWRDRMQDLVNEGPAFDRMLGNYDPPQGNPIFLRAMTKLLRQQFGWEIGPENLAVTNGGQSAFFFLFNLLAGRFENNKHRKILLPLTPEYIGYADQGIDESLFVACKPEISWPDGPESRIFKYRIDFAAVEKRLAEQDIAAIAVSRPTNPTGNVLTDEEIRRLSDLAARHGIPFIIDNAYGTPFPGVIFADASPFWAPHVILTLSLSKLGLPGTRTAIVIGPEQITKAVAAMTAIAGLANGNIGQQLVLPLIESGEILNLGPQHLIPFYSEKSRLAQGWIREFFEGTGVDWALHTSEGAFFHWLWLRNLNCSTKGLYSRLKARNVLVVPGEYFYFGLEDDWAQREQCLRLNFSQPAEVVRKGIRIIADEASKSLR
ncbi:valine--pyruvate transaminase [Schlesneria sp. DSM 10557]|uniref:valine--pyruvate transaminase n=1 Tax=Schlesneria sp. DSM 10557 TaxID=3044399 RepID=UPI0035A0ADF4